MRRNIILLGVILLVLISSGCITKKTQVQQIDTDKDGWTDAFEIKQGTDPANPDTDGDGIIDSKDPEPLVAGKEEGMPITTTTPPTTTPYQTTTPPPPTTTPPPKTQTSFAMQKEIIGKWQSADKTLTLEFTDDGKLKAQQDRDGIQVSTDSDAAFIGETEILATWETRLIIYKVNIIGDQMTLADGSGNKIKLNRILTTTSAPTTTSPPTTTVAPTPVPAAQLEVKHYPNPAKFQPGGASAYAYTCVFETSVKAIGGGVRIEKFGAYFWEDGQWLHSTSNNDRPWSSDDFEDWYSCPGAYISSGYECVDSNNWVGDSSSSLKKAKWYYIGADDNGNVVEGEEIIECQPSTVESSLSSIDSDIDMIRDGRHTSWWTPTIYHTAPNGKSGAKLDFSRAGHVLLRGPEKIVEKVNVTDPLFIYFAPGLYEFAYYTPDVTPLYGTWDFKEGKTYNWQAIIK